MRVLHDRTLCRLHLDRETRLSLIRLLARQLRRHIPRESRLLSDLMLKVHRRLLDAHRWLDRVLGRATIQLIEFLLSRNVVRILQRLSAVVQWLQVRLHYLTSHVTEALTTWSARLQCTGLLSSLYLLIPDAAHFLSLHLIRRLLLKTAAFFPAERLSLHGRASDAINLLLATGSS